VCAFVSSTEHIENPHGDASLLIW